MERSTTKLNGFVKRCRIKGQDAVVPSRITPTVRHTVVQDKQWCKIYKLALMCHFQVQVLCAQ
jgi:hypothetical protein